MFSTVERNKKYKHILMSFETCCVLLWILRRACCYQ